MDFEEFHKFEEFQHFYQTALDLAMLDKHPALFERPLKILDIQGGVGIIGKLLQKQFEGIEDYAEYTNVDRNNPALKKSPGKVISWSSESLSTQLNGHLYDAIFSLNHETFVRPKEVDVERFKGVVTAIRLFNVGTFLQENGRYVCGGLLTKDNIEAFANFFKGHKTGIELEKCVDIPLPRDIAKLWADFDLEKLGIKKDNSRGYERFVKGYGNIKIASFYRKKLPENLVQITEILKKFEKNLGEHYQYLEMVDRLGLDEEEDDLF